METSAIISYLKFIESFSFEDQHYISVSNLQKRDYEIFYRRGYSSDSKSWTVREKGCEGSYEFTSEGLVEFCIENELDLIELGQQLSSKIFTMCAFADMFLREAKNAFGDVAVDGAIADMRQFYDELLSVVEKLTPGKSKPKLTVVKND